MGFFDWSAPMFGRFADRWDAEGIRDLAAHLRPFVAEDGRLLDLGGGTGALAAHLADALRARVTILDANPKMLAYAPRRDDITVILGVAEKMPFVAHEFDAVVITDAFHHFRDQDGAGREIARVLRPGGGVLVIEQDPCTTVMRVIAPFERLLGEPGAFLTPEEMCAFWARHGVTGECARQGSVTYRFIGELRG